MSDSHIQSSQEHLIFENLEWMNTEDAARYLRRSVGQIRNMVYRGQITFRKFNSRLYFRKSDLSRALEFSNNGGLNGYK